jgi:hypothetical protein
MKPGDLYVMKKKRNPTRTVQYGDVLKVVGPHPDMVHVVCFIKVSDGEEVAFHDDWFQDGFLERCGLLWNEYVESLK